ncbi:PDR/VanB family oxidoreductase [Thauera humireducens]|uniref:Iron-sulfur protein n=1 Tax=Thauera humireducens TaxID=1134435 RepID=A0A127KAV9_9RHOO|nr:PDR/VanB family oxidoreductase [Thauera humireducens]AMO38804.1 iron-sulfur protein [Thauera humireducens]
MNTTIAHAASSGRIELLVRQIRMEAKDIHSYELIDPDGRPLPAFAAGAHIDVHIAPNLIRQYSLCNDPAERHRYVIGVLRDERGRGGSKALHERLRVGDRVTVGTPRNSFELAAGSGKTILLAGGIGITPLKAMAHVLEASSADFELHYCARGPESVAFQAEMTAFAPGECLHYHFDGGNPANGLDIEALLARPVDGSHLYYCGPAGFMEACRKASAHWPAGSVHCEHFKAPAAAQPSTNARDDSACVAEIASTGQKIVVRQGQSLAEALQAAGLPVETSCQSGLCGACKVRYLCGDIDHQDYILDDDARREFFTPCVSRPRSGMVVLDL